MDLSKLGADLQAAVDGVVKTKALLDKTEAAVAAAQLVVRKTEKDYADALKTAQTARDAFTAALSQVVPGGSTKSISG